MKLLKSTVIVFAAILSLNAIAREAVPIVNYENLAVVTNSAKVLSANQVKQAILVASGAKGWSIAELSDGKLQGTLTVRNKHTIVVEIAYSAEKYSLTYKDSSNMKFAQRNGQSVIHPFYNNWVKELTDAIHIELLKA